MSLTNTLIGHSGKQPSSPTIILALDVDFDDAYAAGGEAFDAPALLQSLGGYDKAPTVLGVVIENAYGYMFEYDRTNKKIIVRQGDYDPAAVGPFVEASGDLATLLNVRVLIFAM